MPTYEFVPRSEYAPVRRELEEIIRRVQLEMRRRHHLTFQFHLIGSGKRHLVTRVKGGNGGYDFDYNLILPHKPTCKPEKLNRYFMDAFQAAIKGTRYSFPKDSTSAITIKDVDTQKSRVRHSCDFAIIYYADDGYYYLRNNKAQGTYGFAFRPMRFDIDKQVAAIREHNAWSLVRKEYLDLKSKNRDKDKHSFSIFIETVNNVYNQIS